MRFTAEDAEGAEKIFKRRDSTELIRSEVRGQIAEVKPELQKSLQKWKNPVLYSPVPSGNRLTLCNLTSYL